MSTNLHTKTVLQFRSIRLCSEPKNLQRRKGINFSFLNVYRRGPSDDKETPRQKFRWNKLLLLALLIWVGMPMAQAACYISPGLSDPTTGYDVYRGYYLEFDALYYYAKGADEYLKTATLSFTNASNTKIVACELSSWDHDSNDHCPDVRVSAKNGFHVLVRNGPNGVWHDVTSGSAARQVENCWDDGQRSTVKFKVFIPQAYLDLGTLKYHYSVTTAGYCKETSTKEGQINASNVIPTINSITPKVHQNDGFYDITFNLSKGLGLKGVAKTYIKGASGTNVTLNLNANSTSATITDNPDFLKSSNPTKTAVLEVSWTHSHSNLVYSSAAKEYTLTHMRYPTNLTPINNGDGTITLKWNQSTSETSSSSPYNSGWVVTVDYQVGNSARVYTDISGEVTYQGGANAEYSKVFTIPESVRNKGQISFNLGVRRAYFDYKKNPNAYTTKSISVQTNYEKPSGMIFDAETQNLYIKVEQGIKPSNLKHIVNGFVEKTNQAIQGLNIEAIALSADDPKFKQGYRYYTASNIATCVPSRFEVQTKVGNDNLPGYLFVLNNQMYRPSQESELESFIASKGYYNDHVDLRWTINPDKNHFTHFVVKRHIITNDTTLLQKELSRITHEPGKTEYYLRDDHTLSGLPPAPGSYYKYELQGIILCDEDFGIATTMTDIGFSEALGSISGKVTMQGGIGVNDVNILFINADDTDLKSIESNNALDFQQPDKLPLLQLPTPYVKGSTALSIQFYAKVRDNKTGTQRHQLFIGRDSIPNAQRQLQLWLDADRRLNMQLYDKTPVKLDTIFPKLEYFHFSGVLTQDGGNYTMAVYLNGEKVGDLTVAESRKLDFSAAFVSSEIQDQTFNGLMDELRIWTRALTAKEIKMNHNQYISVQTSRGLRGYYRFNEPDLVGNQVFDISYDTDLQQYNENHGSTSAISHNSGDIPSEEQLAFRVLTDENGNYNSGLMLPFSNSGTTYNIRPQLGVHQFDPDNKIRTLSVNAATVNGVDFTDISAFTVKGKVVYEGGNYPVKGCTFEIDDKPVTLSNGALSETDENGEFVISVPIGVHKLRIVKQGHTFADDGLLLDKSGNEAKDINYNTNIANITFFNQTKVKLIGRLTGGRVEDAKVLGFGESINNIGAEKITLQSTRNQYKFVDGAAIDTIVQHNNGEWKKENALQEDATHVRYKESEIEITVSPITGEFVAWVYPETYRVGDIYVPSAPGTPDRKLEFPNETIDLSSAPVPNDSYLKTSVRTWQDSVLVAQTGMVPHYQMVEKSDTIRYHAEWKYHHDENPTFSVTQIVNNALVDYFGEESITIKNELSQQDEEVTLWSLNDSYTFDMPVFMQGKEYNFALQAYEEYVNYAKSPAEVIYYPVADGLVKMDNNTDLDYPQEPIELDEDGTGIYTFTVGAPDLSTGMGSFYATIDIGDIPYLWDMGTNPIEVWHLGDRVSGTDFMTSGPDEITAILRDPPGSNSYSYIEKGTTIEKTTNYSIQNTIAEELNVKFDIGPKFSTAIGIGTQIIKDNELKDEIATGFESSQKWTREGEKTTTTTFTERFETSSDPLYVGALGDVFIGNSTNIQYGLTNGISIRKGVVDPDDIFTTKDQYSIAKSISLAYGQTFGTRFAYTQIELEEIMIPKWEESIDMLLKPKGSFIDPNTIERPVYLSKRDKDHEDYGKKNSSESYDPYDGDSYQIIFPVSWKDSNGFTEKGKKELESFQDSILWAHNQINSWTNLLKLNEEEKVLMKPLGNYSFGSGASIEYSKTDITSSSYKSDFTWVVSPSVGISTGLKFGGIGVEIEMKVAYTHERSDSETTKNENEISSGFVLAEEGDDDQITVDYGMTTSGTIAFKTRGGRTSCPYEGEYRSKYYEPGRHILSEGTMQIEVPKIDVSSAPQVINVPANKTASFVLDLKNESETDEDVWFELIVDESTNPHGADLKIDGGIIGNGRLFLVKAGEVLKKTLTVAKGSVDSYENIGLILRSQCQHDPTDFLPNIADTTYVSVQFIPSCSDVRIKEPSDKWIMNSDNPTGDILNVIIDNFDVNFPNFGYIRLEYRPASSPDWTTVRTFYPSHLYEKAQGLKEDIGTRSAITYAWKMPEQDGAYELRAVTASVNSQDGEIIGNPLSTYTAEAVTGYKDMSKPTALGAPSPADGILSAGSELSITFNEEIQTGRVIKDNFKISGVLNAQTIAEPNVGLAFDGTGIAHTEFPIYSDGSFSIETWFKRTPNTAGTLFAYGANGNYLSLGFDAGGHAVVKSGSQTLTSTTAIAADETWKYIALTVDRANSKFSLYEYEGATDNALFVNRELDELPASQGKLYVGNEALTDNGFAGSLAQLHFYADKRTAANISSDKSISKNGKELNLIGYWEMNEGEGAVAKDKARARNLSLNTGWYIYPSGKGIALNGSNYVSIPVSTYPLNAFSNLTMEFWFKGGDQAEKTLFSCNEATVAFDADNNMVLNKTDGSLSQTLTTTNLLDNEWHHFALSVKRSGSTKLYIDGENTATFTSDALGSMASADYYFGVKHANPNTYSDYFTGNVDEIRLWNSALTRDLILLNKNSKLKGDEPGLIAYYPFEKYVKQSSGLINVTATMENLCDDFSAEGTAATSDLAVAVKDVRPVEDVPFSFVTSDNKIVFTLDNDYFSRVEGVTLNISAKDIYDMRNNRSNTESWTAYVNRNALLWDSEAIKLSMEEGTTQSFTAKIVNKGGSTLSYAINNLPDWLQVNSSVGNLSPLASKELTFNVSKGINVGNYEASIELTSGNGVNEILPVQLKVTGQRPDWSVNPFDYESNMNITGRIQIMGINQEDEDDLLAAFIGDECVGLTSPLYISAYNSHFTFMTVYGNSQHAGQEITLKLWDASTGNIYPVVESTLNGLAQNLSFVANAIKGDSDTPVIHNALDIVQQDIYLATGWNWISFNVESTNPPLLQQFIERSGSMSNILKSQNDGYVQAPNWVGGLTALNAKNMYLAQTIAAHSLLVNGKAVKPANTPIDIVANGWTWIGYTPQFTLPISSALAGLNPQTGDQIKGHIGFRTYMGSNGWIGNLDYLRPGEGYMYYSKNSSVQSLTYPNATSQFYKMKQNETSEIEKYWSYNAHKYPNNMTITGYVELDGAPAHSDQIEIAAFAGDECRGGVLLADFSQYSDLPYPFMIFLTVYGDEAEKIHFKAYSHEEAVEYSVTNEPITYITNSVIGDPSNPYKFVVKKVGSGTDRTKAFLEIYPNPVNDILHIKHKFNKIDILEISDLSGRVLFKEFDFDKNKINVSAFPEGMYLFKMSVDNERYIQKFMKR